MVDLWRLLKKRQPIAYCIESHTKIQVHFGKNMIKNVFNWNQTMARTLFSCYNRCSPYKGGKEMSNQILWDCHMHSSFSADSDTSMEDMILEAIRRGLHGICFTEHLDRIIHQRRIMKLLSWILPVIRICFMHWGINIVQNWRFITGSNWGSSLIWKLLSENFWKRFLWFRDRVFSRSSRAWPLL